MNRITEYILTPIHCVSGYAICIYTGRVVRRLLPGMVAGGGDARVCYVLVSFVFLLLFPQLLFLFCPAPPATLAR